MPYAIPYRRFSSDKQSKGDSVKRQSDTFLSFCERHNLTPWEERAVNDDGESAYLGAHLRGKSNLGDFLVLCESGKIPRGTVLVVENQDRISRDQVNNVVKLFNRIVETGVWIGDALADIIVTDESMNDPMVIMRIVIGAQRAYEYSLSLSRRLKSAWRKKRDVVGTTIMTKTSPFWLTLSEDRTSWIEHPEHVAKVQDIFNLALEGKGVTKLSKALNDSGVTTFKGMKWMPSNILKLLTSRAVLGEFQPMVIEKEKSISKPGKEYKKSKPSGSPIKDYFPQIISPEIFDRVQLLISDRSIQRKGRDTKTHENLFKGLLFDAKNGNPYHQKHAYGKKINGEYRNKKIKLVSVYDTHGGQTSLDYDRFVEAFFKNIEDLDLSTFEQESPASLELSNLTVRLASFDAKLEKVKRLIASEDDIDHLLDTRRELQHERDETKQRLDEVALSARNPLVEVVQEVQVLIKENPKLIKSKMRLLVSEMWVWAQDEGLERVVTVQCHYRNGLVRTYWYSYFTTKGLLAASIDYKSSVLEYKMNPTLDLRNRVKILESMAQEAGTRDDE